MLSQPRIIDLSHTHMLSQPRITDLTHTHVITATHYRPVTHTHVITATHYRPVTYKGKKVKVGFLYSATYTANQNSALTISELAVDWQ